MPFPGERKAMRPLFKAFGAISVCTALAVQGLTIAEIHPGSIVAVIVVAVSVAVAWILGWVVGRTPDAKLKFRGNSDEHQ